MKKWIQLFKTDRQRGTWAILISVLLPILLILSWKAPIQADETVHVNHAEKVRQYFKTNGGDKTALIDENNLLHLYGQSYDQFIHRINKTVGAERSYYKNRHVLIAFMTWICILFASLIAAHLANWRAALITALILVLSPRFLGHGLNNSLDIPFAAGFVFAIYWFLKFLKDIPTIRWIPVVGIIMGIAFAISIRVGGLLLIPTVVFFTALKLLLPFDIKGFQDKIWQRNAIRIGLVMIPIILGSYILGIIRWPFAMQSVFKNPLEALDALSQITNRLRVLFNGEHYWSSDLPWFYYPKFLLLTIPIFFLPFLTASIVWFAVKWKSRFNLEISLILFLAIFPIVYIIFKASGVYNGWRHIIFVYPFLTVFIAVGIEGWMRQFKKIQLTASYIVLAIFLILPLKWMVGNAPYYYVYFNEIVGDVSGAHGLYQTDYYQTSMEEAIDWLALNHPDKTPVTVLTNGARVGSPYLKQEDIVHLNLQYSNYYQRGVLEWDYAIFYSDYLTVNDFKLNSWPPKGTIHTVKIGGAPIAVVLKREDRSGLDAFSAYQGRNLLLALKLIDRAIAYEPMDVGNHILKGDMNYDLGNTDAAIKSWTKVLDLNIELKEIYAKLGALLMETGENTKAEKVLLTLNERFPDDGDGVNLLAEFYFGNQRKSEALAVYEGLLKREPKNHTAYEMGGKLLYRDSMYEAAAQWFGKAAELEPTNPEYQLLVGKTLLRVNQPELAMSYLQSAKKIAASLPELNRNMGDAFLQLGQIENALDLYFEAIKDDPEDYEAYEKLGLNLAKEQDIETAVDVLEEAIKRGLGEERPFNILASIYQATGNEAKFKEYASQADAIILEKINASKNESILPN